MLNKISFSFIAMFICFVTLADDSFLSSYGGNLICAKETRIVLKKEKLSFTQVGNDMLVDIFFEFYNPDGIRKELVGFVTPPIGGVGVDEEDTLHPPLPNISDFTVEVNGNKLNYKVSPITSTEFKNVITSQQEESFVYYFETTFKTGINIIKHTYKMGVSGWSDGSLQYKYKLTTGKNWANSVIEDFEFKLKITGLYTVPKDFQNKELNRWELIGKGKISETDGLNENKNEILFVNIENGYLINKCKNLQPNYDIEINNYFPRNAFEPFGIIYWNYSDNENKYLDKISLEDLKISRNYLFAIHGYDFKNKKTKEYFSKFFWYSPNEIVPNDTIIFSEVEKLMLKKIMELENKKSTQKK